MHTRSHTGLPGFTAEGNRRADAVAAAVEIALLLNVFKQAKISHQLFHQNVPGLVCWFHLTQEQARQHSGNMSIMSKACNAHPGVRVPTLEDLTAARCGRQT